MRDFVSAIVLAAGKGTRMKSEHPKVVHEVFFRPMIHHVLDAIQALSLGQTIVVTGFHREEVEKALQGYNVALTRQEEQLGTGHAVLVAEQALHEKTETVLILCGDTPLIRSETLERMLEDHRLKGVVLTIMTTVLADPTNYGRIVTDDQGRVLSIVEEKDADSLVRQIAEVNAGIYCVSANFLFNALRKIGRNNKQGEMYLTDIVAIAVSSGHEVSRFSCEEPQEVLGVNSRIEQASAHSCFQQRRNRDLMLSGVTLLGPESIAVEQRVAIGRDTIIYPYVYIGGETTIGSHCIIEPFTVIYDCKIGDRATVCSHSHLNDCVIEDGAKIGPHALRV